MNANLATSAPGNPTSSLRTWSAMSAVAALTCLSMITGVAPAVADPPTPPPKAGPTNPPPKTDATPTSGLSRPKVKPNNPKMVGNLVPADDALVGGKSLQVRIPVTRGAKLDVARLDLRPINRYLKRRGNVYVGRVPNVPAGLMHLNVTVTKGKEEARVTSRFTVQAARADLLSALPSTSGKLAAVMGPGVAAVAVTAHPRAAMFATVNGRRVDDDLLGRPEVGGARRFVVSRADGLRPGRNIVETTAYLPDGQWETIRSAVAVPADNPMAEAGVAGRRQQGATVKLDGSRSMPSLSKQSLSYSWRLVSAPAGAKPIAQPSGRTTTLPLNQPGEYVVALTVAEFVGGKRRTSTDLTTLPSVATRPAIGAQLETLTTNTDKLPPAKEGAGTDGIGMVFDGRFRSFAVDFTDGSGSLQPAGLYRIDPRSLAVIPVGLGGTDLDGAVKNALGQAVQGEIIVLQVRADAKITSKNMAGGPYSRVVAYDGQADSNFWGGGSSNAGLQLATSGKEPGPAGSLSGYLRVVVDSSQAQTGFRFLRDSGRLAYSTNVPRTATTGPDGGAIYRLVSATSGKAVSSATDSITDSRVEMDDAGTELSQQWQLVPVYGGLFKLVEQMSRVRCLDATATGIAATGCDEQAVDQSSQLWFPQYDSVRKAYRLVSATAPNDYIGRDGKDETGYLAVDDDTLVLGSGRDQYWYLDIPPGSYAVRVASGSNSQAGRVVAEPDYGTSLNTQLKVATDTAELSQRWQVVDGPRQPGQPQRFSLVNLASGLCADVPGPSKQDNGPINRYACHPAGGDQGKGNQQWTPVATPYGLELQSVATQETLAADTNGNVVQQELDDQAPVKQVWSLQRTLPAAVYDTVTLSLADRSGRSLQLTGDTLSARKTVAPAVGNTWTLGDLGDGHVQIQNLDGQTCIDPYAAGDGSGHAIPQPRPCTTSGFSTKLGADGTWTFSTEDGALVVAADGSLSMQPGAAGTPFAPTGFGGTMQVGRTEYRQTAAAGQSGFWVMAFDQALQPRPGYPKTFVTSGLPAGGRQGQGTQDLATALDALGKVDHTTVLVQSFGRPRPNLGWWNQFRVALDQLGIDGRSVLQLDGTGDFAAAGCVGCNDAPVDNEVTDRTGSQPRGGARLTGQLGWTTTSTRQPSNGTAATLEQGLSALADRDRSASWPFTDDSGSDGHNERAAVNAIYEALGSWPDACHERDADAVRNTYCAQDAATWADRTVQLDNLIYTQVRGSDDTFDQKTFEEVQSTLLREFNEVEQVHSLFDDVSDLLDDSFLDSKAALGPNGAASKINDTIYRPSGPTPTTENNPANAGGWFAVVGDAMIVLKDIVEVGGIILADEPHRRAGEEPEPGLGGSGWSLLADAFLLTADAIDLAGASDDGSTNLGVDITTPLHDYAGKLNTQLAGAVDNLDTVRDTILTDPVTLAAAAMNRTNGPWQLSTDQKTAAKDTFAAGIVRDLWPRQLGAGFQLLRWPTLPDGHGVTDISVDVRGKLHQVYSGQPDNATTFPVERVGYNGTPNSRGTYILTRTLIGIRLSDDQDRVIASSVIDAFYAQTGIARSELPALAPLRNDCGTDDWPFGLDVDESPFFGVAKPESSNFTGWGSDSKDWVSNDCGG